MLQIQSSDLTRIEPLQQSMIKPSFLFHLVDSNIIIIGLKRYVFYSVLLVPALGQLSPPENPLSASKMEGKGGFTQNAIFIRFCISCIFVRFLMNEPDGYVFTQNAIAPDCTSTYPSLKSTHVI